MMFVLKKWIYVYYFNIYKRFFWLHKNRLEAEEEKEKGVGGYLCLCLSVSVSGLTYWR